MILPRIILATPIMVLTLVFGPIALVSATTLSPDDPRPTTPIEHFVVLMQQNHTFDNYFGTYPGADGIPDGACMPVDPTDENNTTCVNPFQLAGRPIEDPAHTPRTFERQFRNGAMDGFVWAHRVLGEDGELAMGYYDDSDLPFYWNVADNYVLFDRFFSSAKGGSIINHMYWMTGQPGVQSIEDDSIPDQGWGSIETIFDRLEEQGVSWKVYVQNYKPEVNFRNRGERGLSPQLAWLPLLSIPRFIDNPELNSKIVDVDQYYEDLRNDALPAVSYVVSIGASENPPGSVTAGQQFVKRLINALMASESWSTSAFMWTYDDWGGWYDHVPPPSVDEFGYGFRVPALLVSPYAKQGYIDGTTLDFTSILKFIEDNYNLEPLASRDKTANSIANAFDFNQSPRLPSIISSVRNETGLVIPWRPAIYGTYGFAFVIAAVIVFVALFENTRTAVAAAVNPYLLGRAIMTLWYYRTNGLVLASVVAIIGSLFLGSVAGAETVQVTNSCLDTPAQTGSGDHETKSTNDASGDDATSLQPPTTSQTGPPLLFADDFEAFGTFHEWDGNSDTMVVQENEIPSGRYAVQATSNGLPAYAQRKLGGSYHDISYRLRFRIVSQGHNPVVLQRLRTDRNEMIVSLYVSSDGRLGYVNHITDKNAQSPVPVSDGNWHELQLRVKIDGRSSEIEVFVDQSPVPELTGTIWLGTYGVGRIDLGDNSGSRIYDIAYDDIAVATSLIPPDRLPDPVHGKLVVRVFPAESGVRFELDGQTFVSDASGIATIEVARWSTNLSERIHVPDSDVAAGRLSFAGWHDWTDSFDTTVRALFDVVKPVTWSFVDQQGNDVDPSLVGSITFQNSIGGVITYAGGELTRPQPVQVTRPVRQQGGFSNKSIVYVVQSVCVNGSNVVNQGQARFDPLEQSEWQITLLFYSANFRSRDALFGTPIGRAVRVTFPDGTNREEPLGPTGEAQLPALPRGEYQVSVIGGGYSPPRPITLTRNQQVDLTVVSRLDVFLAGGVLSIIALGLLIIGRPQLLLTPLAFVGIGRQRRVVLAPSNVATQRHMASNGFADVGTARHRGRSRHRWILAGIAVLIAIAIFVGAFATGMAATPVSTAMTSPVASSRTAPNASPVVVVNEDRHVPILAYYYIWFDTTSWRRAKTDMPLLGRYSSDDPAVMRQHVQWAKAAGIEGFIVSWKDTPVLTSRLNQLIEIANQEDFKLAIIYQGLDYSRQPIPVERVEADLDFFTERYANDPAFAIFERPIVIWSGTWEFTPEQIEKVTEGRQQRLMILASERRPDTYSKIAKFVAGNAYYWSSVDPTTYPGYAEKLNAMASAVHAGSGLWIAPVAPGFDARHMGGEREVARKDGATLRQEMTAALASSPDAIGLISWNEFSENSHVEPSCTYGTDDLKTLVALTGGSSPVNTPTCDEAALAEVLAGAVTTLEASPDTGVAAEAETASNESDFDSSSPGTTDVRARSLAVLLGLGGVMVASVAIVIQRTRREAINGQAGRLKEHRKSVI